MINPERIPVAYRPVLWTPQLDTFSDRALRKGVKLPRVGARLNILTLDEMRSLSALSNNGLIALRQEFEQNLPESFGSQLTVDTDELVGTNGGRRDLLALRIEQNELLEAERRILLRVIQEGTGLKLPERGDFQWQVAFGVLPKVGTEGKAAVVDSLQASSPRVLVLDKGVVD